jgi:N-acyl-D-amino-acid deacylase
VTSEISGNCGFSLFPGEEKSSYVKNCPFTGKEYTIDADTFADYLSLIRKNGIPLNMGFLAGHGTLRNRIAGRENRRLLPKEIDTLKHLFREQLNQGNIGLSLGFAYPPGCFANAEEIVPLAEEAAEQDVIIASHIRNEGDALAESIEEFISIGERTGCKLQVSHIKAMWPHNWKKADEIIQFLGDKRSNGVDITCDRYPYTASSTNLDHLLPPRFYEGGNEKEMERLKDEALLPELEEEIYSLYGEQIFSSVQVVHIPGEHSYTEFAGCRVNEIADAVGLSPFKTYVDLLLAGSLNASAVYHGMSENNLVKFLSLPYVCIGSDSRYRSIKGISSEGVPHPRSYGTFARILGRFCREKQMLTLEDALYKMTAFPAERFNIKQRGFLKKGYKADITIFDPDTIIDKATFKNPHQYSEGVRYVLINGKVVIDDGELVCSNAGEVIRGDSL